MTFSPVNLLIRYSISEIDLGEDLEADCIVKIHAAGNNFKEEIDM